MSSTWNTISGDWDSQTREWNQIPFSPAKGDLTLTGQVPYAVEDSAGVVGKGDLTLSGQIPISSITLLMEPGKADLTLTGSVPQIHKSISVGKGDLTLTGQVPVATENKYISPAKGDLTLTGSAPSRTIQREISPAKGDLTLTGYTAQIHKVITVGAGSLSGLERRVPWDEETATWAAFSGNWDVGYSPTVSHQPGMFEAGSLSITGGAVSVSHLAPKFKPTVLII